MYFDSNTLMILIMNLAVILAVSLITIQILKYSQIDFKHMDLYLPDRLIDSVSPVELQVKRYLVVRRMIKADPDDDSPYFISKF